MEKTPISTGTLNGNSSAQVLPGPHLTKTPDSGAPARLPVALPAPSALSPQPSAFPVGWAAVSHYADLAGKFQHCALACQVMAGFALLELHQAAQIKPGRPTTLVPSVPSVPSVPDNSFTVKEYCPQGKWPDLVKQHSGLSEATAWRWMEMARACKPRLKKLDGQDRLRELVNTPPSTWTQDDVKLLETTLHKLTDGQTQLEFMRELGLAKKPNGATGGARDPGEKKILTIDEALAVRKKSAQDRIEQAFFLLEEVAADFTLLEDFHLNAQIARLETYLKARKTWLAQPITKRDPKPILTMLKPPLMQH